MEGFITEPVKITGGSGEKDYNTIKIMGLQKIGFDPHLKIITKDGEEHVAMGFEDFKLSYVEPNNYTSEEYGEKKQIKLVMDFKGTEYRMYANLTDVSVGILNCIASESEVKTISVKFGWRNEPKTNKDKTKENLVVKVFLNGNSNPAKWALDRKGKDLNDLATQLFALINSEERDLLQELQQEVDKNKTVEAKQKQEVSEELPF